MAPLQQATRTVPIVFAAVADPVGSGFVVNLARPGGNATGFANLEYGMSGKWLELLKQIAPSVTRVAVLRDPTVASGSGQFGAIQAVRASILGMEVAPVGMRGGRRDRARCHRICAQVEWGLDPDGWAEPEIRHRDLIIALAARHRLPAVYANRFFVTGGGLISYGTRSSRPVPAGGRLCRSHSQGREARRPAGAGADQVRAGASTSRPPRRLASTCRRCCLRAPTR